MISEAQVVGKVRNYFVKEGYAVQREVPIMLRRIDLVAFDQRSNDIIAIEVKVQDWHRALRQAIAYRLFSNKSYVALWHRYLHRIENNLGLFEQYGIGVLSVDGKVNVVSPATPSKHIHSSLIKIVRGHFKHIGD